MTEKQQSVTTESVTTIIIAGGANLAIAIAKVIAGVISGSASMLSEAAHSFADTTTEVLLYVALRRSTKPADRRHPFGYGRAAFVWALIAALFTLVAGAGLCRAGGGLRARVDLVCPGDQADPALGHPLEGAHAALSAADIGHDAQGDRFRGRSGVDRLKTRLPAT